MNQSPHTLQFGQENINIMKVVTKEGHFFQVFIKCGFKNITNIRH